MAKRKKSWGRLLGGALVGAAQGLQPGLQRMAAEQSADRQNERIMDRQTALDQMNREQEIQNLVLQGKITPEQGEAMRHGGALADLAPSDTTRAQPLIQEITKATDPATTPDASSLLMQLKGMGVGIVPEQIGTGPQGLQPAADAVLGVRRRKLEAFDQQREDKITDAGREASTRALATGDAAETIANKYAPQVLGRELEKERAIGSVRADQQVDTEGRLSPIRTQQAINTERGTAPIRTQAQITASTTANRINEQYDENKGVGKYKPEKPTEAEAKNAGYARNAATAHEIMLRLEPALSKRSGWRLTYDQLKPGLWKDPAMKQYVQAVTTFINANARRESGATVTPEEFQRYSVMFQLQPGDDDASLKQRQNGRLSSIKGIAESAGVLGQKVVTLQEVMHAMPKGTKPDDAYKAALAEGLIVIR